MRGLKCALCDAQSTSVELVVVVVVIVIISLVAFIVFNFYVLTAAGSLYFAYTEFGEMAGCWFV